MRFKRHIELEKGQRQIDIAPLIDVVFLLLIFFMLTSTFIVRPRIKVNLPTAVTSKVTEEEDIIITITADDLVHFDGKIVQPEELLPWLGRIAEKKRSLLIRADKKTSLGKVVEVWDLCRKADISEINIATLKEP